MGISLVSIILLSFLGLLFVVGMGIIIYNVTSKSVILSEVDYDTYRKYLADVGVMNSVLKIVKSKEHVEISSALADLQFHLKFFEKHKLDFGDKSPEEVMDAMELYGRKKVFKIYGFDKIEKRQTAIANAVRSRFNVKQYFKN
jgi:hypothetical protein